MKAHAATCCILALGLAVAGCSTSGPSGDRVKGTAGECAALAAVELLSPIIYTPASCLAGAAIAALLDQREQQALADARVQAAESGERVDWSAPPAENPSEANAPQPNDDKSERSAPASAPPPSPSGISTSAPKIDSAASPPATSEAIAKGTKSYAAASRAKFSVTPTKSYVGKNGEPCTDEQEHVEKSGKKIDANGALCKIAGAWKWAPKNG